MNTEIDFRHGLGDSVQLVCVLQHLKKYRPDWKLFLKALRGKHSVGRGHCEAYWHDGEPAPRVPMNQTFKLGWYENYNRYTDCPNSKVTNCLREVFKIEPDPALLRYRLFPADEDRTAAASYLDSIGVGRLPTGRTNAVVLHTQGNTTQHRKNLSHETTRHLIDVVRELGFVPILLDWDRRSSLPDQKTIFSPGVDHPLWNGYGTGDALRITALIEQCSLFLGVDSGPQKCAGATDTPSIGLWTGHSPVQFFDLCPNFTHLVPSNFESIPPCNHPGVRGYFVDHYPFRTYDWLEEEAGALIRSVLGDAREKQTGFVKVGDFWCPDYKPEQFRIIVNSVYRDDEYRTRHCPRAEGVEYVVDLGASVGVFARLWHERNPLAKIACVEPHPGMAAALRANVSGFAEIIEAACHYADGEVFLLDAMTPLGESTGSSIVASANELREKLTPAHLLHGTPLAKFTLEEIRQKVNFPHIDALKVDVEGSELSILAQCDLSTVRRIFVESHDHQRWLKLLMNRFQPQTWDVKHIHMGGKDNQCSIWHLTNKEFRA